MSRKWKALGSNPAKQKTGVWLQSVLNSIALLPPIQHIALQEIDHILFLDGMPGSISVKVPCGTIVQISPKCRAFHAKEEKSPVSVHITAATGIRCSDSSRTGRRGRCFCHHDFSLGKREEVSQGFQYSETSKSISCQSSRGSWLSSVKRPRIRDSTKYSSLRSVTFLPHHLLHPSPCLMCSVLFQLVSHTRSLIAHPSISISDLPTKFPAPLPKKLHAPLVTSAL